VLGSRTELVLLLPIHRPLRCLSLNIEGPPPPRSARVPMASEHQLADDGGDVRKRRLAPRTRYFPMAGRSWVRRTVTRARPSARTGLLPADLPPFWVASSAGVSARVADDDSYGILGIGPEGSLLRFVDQGDAAGSQPLDQLGGPGRSRELPGDPCWMCCWPASRIARAARRGRIWSSRT